MKTTYNNIHDISTTKTAYNNIHDTFAIAKRCLLLSKRNPDTLLTSIVLPVMMMLLFVALFENLITIGSTSYVNYIFPGVLMQCLGQCSSVTAIGMNKDAATGIMCRFSTLPIKKSCILNGRILEAFFRNLLTSAVVMAAALLLGFQPKASAAGWLLFLLLLLGVILAFSWLAMAIGIFAGTPEGASGLFAFVIVLPYLSSGFVPTESMPKLLALFARSQPMTPIIDVMRSALLGLPIPSRSLAAAFIWCAIFILCFYFISLKLFHKRLENEA